MTTYKAKDLDVIPSFGDVIKKPLDFFRQQYYGAGLGANISLPLGVLNFSIALPLHEPPNSTWSRIQSKLLDNLKFNVHIGTTF